MKRLFHLAITLFFFLLIIPSVFAASPDPGQSLGCGGNFGPIADVLCTLTSKNSETVGIETNKVVSGIIGFLTVVASLWFGLQLILAGYDWISSSGDKSKIETAQNKIVYSLIGIIIITTAWVLIGLIGTLMGLNILNPGEILKSIGE